MNAQALTLYLKGFCMGIADIIPGVSGGTMAFVLGIYDELIATASSLDHHLLKLLFKGRFKELAQKLNIKFAIPLVLGIGSAFILMARLVHYLLAEYAVWTWALFFGLILGSIVLLTRHYPQTIKGKNILYPIGGTIFAYFLVGIIPVQTPNDLWFIFLCGAIGIIAMILPGISGSFILLLLGKYEYITGAIKNPLHVESLMIIFPFLLGTATGLISFSKILNFCLKRFPTITLGFLIGFLVGSLRKIWPWKEVLSSKIIRGKERVISEINILPANFDTEVVFAIIFMLIGLGLIWLLEHKGQQKSA